MYDLYINLCSNIIYYSEINNGNLGCLICECVCSVFPARINENVDEGFMDGDNITITFDDYDGSDDDIDDVSFFTVFCN